MMLVCWFVHCLLIMLSIAFFTLFERKVMGLFHNRFGPNKVSFIGLLQPLLDAFKLLSKQSLVPLRANKFTYHFAPHIALTLAFFVWMTLPSIYFMLSMNYSLLLFYCLSSVMVFATLLTGWSSNSKYSLIGSLRAVAQSVSYESVFSTLIVLFMFLIFSFSIRSAMVQSSVVFLYLLPVWMICVLAETHRSPFDFSESESELVSGFNTEFSGAYFAFLFLSEYGMLLYSCVLMTYLFFMWLVPVNVCLITSMALVMSFISIWIRITFCRFRYDMLMMTFWKIMLPLALMLFVVFVPLVLCSGFLWW